MPAKVTAREQRSEHAIGLADVAQPAPGHPAEAVKGEG
jgi:hypothetical protein